MVTPTLLMRAAPGLRPSTPSEAPIISTWFLEYVDHYIFVASGQNELRSGLRGVESGMERVSYEVENTQHFIDEQHSER